MGLGGVISNLLSSVGKLLPVVTESVQALSTSSSSSSTEGHQIEAELKALMRMLERIKATLYDAEGREIVDRSVKLWLKELKQVAYDAEDVLDEYNYEVLRAQVETKNASQPDSSKRKQIQIPDGMSDQIKDIKDKFDEIEKHRIALRLSDEDGPRRVNSELQIAPTSHFVEESNIFGREVEKEKLIAMLSSDCDDGNVVHVVTIVGPGGLGKTTLTQLVYNDQRIKKRFDKFGWICVSKDFNVQRLIREAIESLTGNTFSSNNLSALQNKISKKIRGKRLLLILDDVWNENRNHWELFRGPFTSAKEAKVLVTTRNESVAIIMQTVPSFKLGYMSEEQCWGLFKHYAFAEANQNEDPKFLEVGKKILEKCGKLPLAIKSVASLLRHEAEDKAWIEILESEMWNYDKLCNEIFTPLQLSYTRLPTYLKPCFLYCSLFPKDYNFTVKELVRFWISQGYVASNGKKSAKNIGEEYAKQLWQRSFFEGKYEETDFQIARFKLHDIVHDLARSNSGNACYSIEAGKEPVFPHELYHLYVKCGEQLINSLPLRKIKTLRTLISDSNLHDFDISQACGLRSLKLEGYYELLSVSNLKHLRYLSLTCCHSPEHLSSLYFLQYLALRKCDTKELSENIGNLVNLEQLVIDRCEQLEELPTEMGSLKNIQTLKVRSTTIGSLPASLNKIIGNIQTLHVTLKCETIGWLHNFVDLNGFLVLVELSNVVSLEDVECANLQSMQNLECLVLLWSVNYGGRDRSFIFSDYSKRKKLQLTLTGVSPFINDIDHSLLMARLQPHPNLRGLHIEHYPGDALPKWMENPTSCAFLERIIIDNCNNLGSFQFGKLCKLKYLEINWCRKLQFIRPDSLPLQLEELTIIHCEELISAAVQKLKSLVILKIDYNMKLQQLVMESEASDELIGQTYKASFHKSLSGLRNLTSLRRLSISRCSKLQAFADDLRPVESCEVTIKDCPGLKDWCSYHIIPYKEDITMAQESSIHRIYDDEIYDDYYDNELSDVIFGDELDDQIFSDELDDEIFNEIYDERYDELDGDIFNEIYDERYDELDDEIFNKMYDELDDQIFGDDGGYD